MSQTHTNAERLNPAHRTSGLASLQASSDLGGLIGQDALDHLALIYETREEQLATVVPFIRQGLERGERCMYIAHDIDEAELREALRAGDVDVDAAIDSGALSIHSVEETYRKNGAFDAEEGLELIREAKAEALEQYEGFRVSAEETWLGPHSSDAEEFMACESHVNDICDEDCFALCQYNRAKLPTSVIEGVLRTHPYLVVDDTVCENFYYTPPSEYFAPDQPAYELDRKLETLVDRTDARATLQTRERFLHEAYEITSDPNRSFDEKLERLLQLGCEQFDLDVGCLTHLPSWDDDFRIEKTVGPDGGPPEGLPPVQPGDGCFCRQAITGEEPRSVQDVRDVGWEGDPVFQQYGITSYFGTRVTVGSEPYGTLWFGSTAPRDQPFTDAERTFLDLMGQWVSYELEQREHTRYLEDLSEITADGSLSFDEKVEQILDLGRDRFDLGIGMLTHEQKDAFEIEKMRGHHPDLEEGVLTPPMTDNYCRRVVDTGETIDVADAGVAGWEEDELYSRFDLQCYVGVQIGDSTPYGTICFTDLSPRDRSFTKSERTFLELMAQCVSYELQRKQREDRLDVLNTLSRDLMSTETVEATSEVLVETADDLGLPVTAIALLDEEEGTLDPIAWTDAAAVLLRAISPFEVGDSVGWTAFVESERVRLSEPLAESAVDAHPEVTELVAQPLGQQGVLLTGATESTGFDEGDDEFVETVAANTEAAFDRVRREAELQDREEALATQNETLERLNQINDTIRGIDQALVQASNRAEIESVVCDELADTGPYELAWIGGHDAVTQRVTPREWAGGDRGYLDGITVATDESPEAQGPIGSAVKTGEPQVANDILTDREFEPWRQAALNRGYHSAIALPLTYDDELYGVLTLYASKPGAFDELEREVLSELADNIAHGINAVESKKALVSDEFTELEVRFEDESLALGRLTREHDCEVELENVVPRSDGGFRAFFTVHGIGGDTLTAFTSTLPSIDARLVSESDADENPVCLVETTIDDGGLTATVLEHGGRLHELRAAGGTVTATIHMAMEADVHEFMDMLRTKYRDPELVAKRPRERTRQTPMELSDLVTSELTDRQLEVLQTAVHSGYFEQPRTRTASEIADVLDIAQPTFSTHLRTAQRKLYETLLDVA